MKNGWVFGQIEKGNHINFVIVIIAVISTTITAMQYKGYDGREFPHAEGESGAKWPNHSSLRL